MDSHPLGDESDAAAKARGIALMTTRALTPGDFEPHVGADFRVEQSGLTLRLEAVQRLGSALREGGGFALTFLGPVAPMMPQAIYPLAHEGLGTIDIFIVPVSRDAEGSRYEAIFT